jgi:hypothetical protein
MPKFEKGSAEAIEYMRTLRERRKNRPLSAKQIEVQNILNEALNKYFMAGSAVVEVPDKIVKVDNKGNPKIIDTLTKSGTLKKIKGESVIKLETGNDLNIKTKGKKFNDAVNLPTQTITHNKPIKSSRNKKADEDKILNDTIEFKNIDIEPEKDYEKVNLPIQIIKHNKPSHKLRTINFKNIELSPEKNDDDNDE